MWNHISSSSSFRLYTFPTKPKTLIACSSYKSQKSSFIRKINQVSERNRPMEEANARRYWCHMCSLTAVNPVMEDEIKCPHCRSGFVEEMEVDHQRSPNIWAPILMEMMINSRANHSVVETENGRGGTDLDSQLQEILRRRGRRSTTLSGVQLPHGERGHVIFINPHSQIIAGSMPAGAGFEALLQRLAENDPNRYGTAPARKEDVESLATIKIQEASLQCSVCLDDFEIGTEAKQMPCKHSFHADCLLPWLELHSSCPVCRYQLPTDTKTDSATTETNGNNGGSESSGTSSTHGTENSDVNFQEEEEQNSDGGRIGFSIPWPFSSFFYSSSSQDSSPSRGTD